MAAGTLTVDDLREVAGFRASGECAISLYADLDPSAAPTAGDVDTRFNALLSEAEKLLARESFSHDEREAVKRDLERIRSFLDNDFDRDGVRGLAIFAAGEAFWQTFSLPERVPDAIKVRRDFHVAPLASRLGHDDGTLVAVVTRERGHVYRLRAGRLEEVLDETEEQPGRHDQGGWSQARYQRHIEKLVQDHYRGVAEALDGQVRKRGGPKIVLVAPEEQRSDVLDALQPDAKDAVVGVTHAAAHATAADLLEVVRPVLASARATEERELLDRWREEAGRGARAASGWGETVEAASDGRVELLLFAPGANRQLWQCPSCLRGSAEAGNCPLDGTPLEAVAEGLDVVVQRTLAHGGAVFPVAAQPDLDPVEGIGALLRY